jgi:ribosomal protein S9
MEQRHRPSQIQRRPRVSEKKGYNAGHDSGKDVGVLRSPDPHHMICRQPVRRTSETFDIAIIVHGGGEVRPDRRSAPASCGSRLRRNAQARVEPGHFVTRDAREVERKGRFPFSARL